MKEKKHFRIWLGGLDRSSNEADLRQLVERCGITVLSLSAPTVPDQGWAYAFLNVPGEQGEKAIRLLHRRMFNGREMVARESVGRFTAKMRQCRVCRCTEGRACVGGCSWISAKDDLCNVCRDAAEAMVSFLIRANYPSQTALMREVNAIVERAGSPVRAKGHA